MTLDKMLIQVRRIAEHRELGAEKKIRAAYKQCLKELKQFIGYEYAALAEDGKLTYDILAKKQEQARFLEEVQRHIDGIAPNVRDEITRLISEVYDMSYNGMVNAASLTAPMQIKAALGGLEYVQPEQVASGVNNTLINKIMLNDVLEKNRKSVIYDLKQAVNIGLTNGETVDLVAKRISTVLDGDYKKAVRVARTETHRVREAGLSDGAKDFDEKLKAGNSGMRMAKTWRTMKDNRVRPNVVRKSKKGTVLKMGHGANHIQMEGQTVLCDEKFELSDGNMTDAPGQSGIAAQDINCRCFVRYRLISEDEYVKLTGKNFAGKVFTNEPDSGIIRKGDDRIMQSGAFYGALNPESDKDFARCEEHANKYYEEIRRRTSDVKEISKNTGYSEEYINDVKLHIFMNKYDLGEDEPTTFYPNYDIAVSWQNLIEGKNIEEKDIILLKHEHHEYMLMKNDGLSYIEAHEMTQKLYNYQKAVIDWRAKK